MSIRSCLVLWSLLSIFAMSCRTNEAGKTGVSELNSDHSNTCISDLAVLNLCQDRVLGVPKNIQACCDGVRKMADDQCQCNPAVNEILGEAGRKIYDIEILCRSVQPFKWARTRPFFIKDCKAFETHDYGCEKPDSDIDAARFNTIQKLGDLFSKPTEDKCFDTPKVKKLLEEISNEDAEYYIPYGAGSYKGAEDVAEYLGLVFSTLTHQFWSNDGAPDASKKNRLEISKDGHTWITGTTVKGSFLNKAIPYEDAYLEQTISFKGCETKIGGYKVVAGEDFKSKIIERFVQTAELSQRWGAEDICRYHTQYCAGDPTTKQYASEKACLDYMKKLPLYTKACGPNRPLAGHSLTCKLKHHFMIPTNPGMHCAHIGPKGSADINQHLKCDDESECSADEGQESWPAVELVGKKTPADIQRIFEDSNKNYKNEPFGCAIRTEESTKAHIH